VWTPDPLRWPDLKGFIERQHDAGRRVLLWIATWLQEGLPKEWCIHSGRIPLVADPTNPAYRRFLADQVHQLLSPKGYDADGFKIDQLAFVPSERLSWACVRYGRCEELPACHPRIRATGSAWGCELLYQLQKDIYGEGGQVRRAGHEQHGASLFPRHV
jgi:alpha-glucosidase (family GH31 glycosyl hydrolase)